MWHAAPATRSVNIIELNAFVREKGNETKDILSRDAKKKESTKVATRSSLLEPQCTYVDSLDVGDNL